MRLVLPKYTPATDAARVMLFAAAVQLVFGWTKSFPVSIGRPNLRILAHGIGGIRDLPVPRYVFYYGAAGVLVISFAALAFLWRKPVLERRRDGRPLTKLPGSGNFMSSPAVWVIWADTV